MTDAVVFFTTLSSSEAAHDLARDLVSKGFAACVNVLPEIKSFYTWEGVLHAENEILLIGKTTEDRFTKLKKEIKSLHPYEVPELIAIPIADGLPAYLKWLADPK